MEKDSQDIFASSLLSASTARKLARNKQSSVRSQFTIPNNDTIPHTPLTTAEGETVPERVSLTQGPRPKSEHSLDTRLFSSPKNVEFDGYDLSDMLGIQDIKKQVDLVSKNTDKISVQGGSSTRASIAVGGTGNRTSIGRNSSDDDDIPSFLKAASAHSSVGAGSGEGRRRGGGHIESIHSDSLNFSSQKSTAPIEILKNKNTKDDTKKIENPLNFKDEKKLVLTIDNETVEPLPQLQLGATAKPPSILEILNIKDNLGKTTRDMPAVQPLAKLSIFDIIEKHPPIKSSVPDSSDLSSVAELSSTDSESLSEAPDSKTNKRVIDEKKGQSQLIPTAIQIGNQEEVNALKAQIKTLEDEIQHLKTTTTELNSKVIKEIEEKHKAEMDARANEITALNNQMSVLESVCETRIAKEMQEHVMKLSDVISNAQGIKTLHQVAEKVQVSAKAIDALQEMLADEHHMNLKARETAVLQKEVDLARLQEEYNNNDRQLQKERKNLEIMIMETLESKKLADLKVQNTAEKLEQDGIRLRHEMAMLEKSRDTIEFTFKQEKEAFKRQQDVWNEERLKMMEQINKDRKEISVLKPQLESQMQQLMFKEQEWEQKKVVELNQIDSERKACLSDQKELMYRQKVLHREESMLKTETLRLGERQREIDTMASVYHKEEADLQKKFLQLSKVRDEAANKRSEAISLLNANELLVESLDSHHQRCKEDLEKLAVGKKSYIDDRILKSLQLQQVMQYPVIPTNYAHDSDTRRAHDKTEPEAEEANPVSAGSRYRSFSRYSQGERDLAAALELQLEGYISKLKQGHSQRKLHNQRIVIDRTKLK